MHHNMIRFFFMLIACTTMAIGGCALQDDVIVLEERLIVLERQNQMLQKKNETLERQIEKEVEQMGLSSKTSEKNLRSNYAGLNANMDNMQSEMSALNGRIEELDYRINRELKNIGPLSNKVDEMAVSMGKYEQRIVQLEQYLNFDSAQKTGPSKAATSSPAAANSEQQLYDEAKKAYDNGELDKARQGFMLLIKTYPKSEHADNAQFWIGESYYREKWYEKAILEYQSVLEKYPKGNKVPAAMLKQGLAFLKLGDKSNARLILKELQKKHPKSNEARIASQKLSEF